METGAFVGKRVGGMIDPYPEGLVGVIGASVGVSEGYSVGSEIGYVG